MPTKGEREEPRYLFITGTRILLGIDKWTLVHFLFFEGAQVLRICSSEKDARRTGEEFQIELEKRDPEKTENRRIGMITPTGRIFTRRDNSSRWEDLTETVLEFF